MSETQTRYRSLHVLGNPIPVTLTAAERADNPLLCLDHWQGSTLVYVGESANGCTGSRAFHERLEAEFEEVEIVSIPQWSGLYDYLAVYRRKPA